jgi:peptide/nickel transport system permease protein
VTFYDKTMGRVTGWFERSTDQLAEAYQKILAWSLVHKRKTVLLAVAISGALGAGILNAILALTLVFVPPIIRVAESVTTGVRNLDFVDAARASGASAFTIVRVHVLGNVLGPIFVYSTSLISVCMILASGLSFLGLGTRPPEAEWGLMLNTLRTAIYVQPWVAVLPGVCIFVTSICFNLVSDGLRQAMDVKS